MLQVRDGDRPAVWVRLLIFEGREVGFSAARWVLCGVYRFHIYYPLSPLFYLSGVFL